MEVRTIQVTKQWIQLALTLTWTSYILKLEKNLYDVKYFFYFWKIKQIQMVLVEGDFY